MTGTRPLHGLKVVEFSHMVMGPSCGLILADLGADVVKVEPAGDGDGTRRLPGSGAGYFGAYNRNKRSVALDLKTPEGLRFAERLAAEADVLVENYGLGVLERLGLSFEKLSAANPRLVYCALKGFLKGPYEKRAALDEVVQMMGGLAYMTGPEGRPLRAGASVNDVMGGMFGAIAIQAALLERERTGRGQFVRAGLFENNMFLVAQHMVQYRQTGKPAAPMPSRVSAWAVYDVFDTGDGKKVFVGVVSDKQWKSFCDGFGLNDLKAEPELQTNVQRVAARSHFMPRIRDLFLGLGLGEIVERCEEIGLPFAPITRPEEMFDDPHLLFDGAMVDVTLPNGTVTPVPALPLEFAGERPGLYRDLPGIGEHGAEIASELGYAESEVERLAADGVLTLGSRLSGRPGPA